MSRHPPFRLLVGYAEDDLQSERSHRIEEHVQTCKRCRSEVAFIEEVGRRLRALPLPRAPAGLFEEIERRRAMGERRILPVAAAGLEPRRESGLRRTWIVALALAAGATAALLPGSRQADAGASSLHFSPSTLSGAAAITVEFRAASRLAGDDQVRLRGRYRTADMGPPRETLGEPFSVLLVRERRGLFRGALPLPPTAVHARFTVESLDGRILETDGGRPWELWEHDDRDRPSFASLRQAFWVAHKESPVEALALARRATELYPDYPEGWHWRFVLEGWLMSDSDSLLAFHRQRFQQLERRLEERRPTSDELSALLRYANSLKDPDAATRALRRLEAQDRANRYAVQQRVLSTYRRLRGSPRDLLRSLEDEWRRSGPAAEFLAERGFFAAIAAEDPGAVETWAARYHGSFPNGPGRVRWVAEEMASLPELRSSAGDMLRGELRRLDATVEERRPLLRTAAAQRQEDEVQAGRLLAVLGKLLLDDGRMAAARDTLALAAGSVSWDPELFQKTAGLLLAAGDTTAALRLHALFRADPFVELTTGDPLAALFADRPAGERESLHRAAELELRDRVLMERASSSPTMLPEPVRVVDASGRPGDLAAMLKDRVTVLVDWDPIMLFEQNAAAVNSLESLLDGTPVQVLAVTKNPLSSPQAEALDRLGLGTPVFVDAYRELATALPFGVLGRFIVVDPDRRISDHGSDFTAAARHALLLSQPH